uniref:Uncharacterized protein n=1 Tax=Moniliophthora roreri TaxID=221103 RepID=A0A0W0FHC9_MONRR
MALGYFHKLVGIIQLDDASQFRSFNNFAFIVLKSIKSHMALLSELAAGVNNSAL